MTGPAAAYWHGMLGGVNVVDLTVPPAAKPSSRTGVRLRRRDLAPGDVIALRDIRLACAGLAALETAVVLPDGAAILDRALQKYVPFDDVYAARAKVAIEIDGWAWHVDQDRFVGDRRKGNALVRDPPAGPAREHVHLLDGASACAGSVVPLKARGTAWWCARQRKS